MTMKFRTLHEPLGYKSNDGSEAERKYRATEIDGQVYAYERQGGSYSLFLLPSMEPDANGVFQVDCFGYDFPSVDFAKLAIEAHAAGVDPMEHVPNIGRARVAGGGWGGHSRTYRTTASCRKCGSLNEARSDTYHADEAREVAWNHWQAEILREMKYESRAARDAQEMGYGDESYWDSLDRACRRARDHWTSKGDPERAELMMKRTLGEALHGNDGI